MAAAGSDRWARGAAAAGSPAPAVDGDAGVAVFAPGAILTVTIELGPTAAPELHLHPGGQGMWVARMAASLGARVTVCTVLGGESGAVLEGLLAGAEVELLGARVGAANGAYVHDRRGGERETVVEIPSGPLSRHEVDDLYGKTLTAALESGTLVLTGSEDRPIAPDVYRRLAKDARENGVTVVADLTREALAGALAGGVDLLKISDEALPREGLEGALQRAIDELHRRGAANVIVSRAAAGAWASIEGELFEAAGPHLEPADHHGAGDSMTAAAAVGIARGLSTEDWMRLATSAGAVNATRHGLGTGARREIEQLASRVRIRPLSR